MKNWHTFILIIFCSINTLFPVNGHSQLKIIQFEQLDSLQKIEQRHVIVFIHTDWCKYCQAMKNTTFKNKEVITILNNKFYFIDLNAEEKRTIAYNNGTFKYKTTTANSGVNELAIQLGTFNKQINYPSICVLNHKNEIILQHNSYLNAKDFKLFLDNISD